MMGFNNPIAATASSSADRAGVGQRRRLYSPDVGASSNSSVSSESTPLEVDFTTTTQLHGQSNPPPNYGSLQHRHCNPNYIPLPATNGSTSTNLKLHEKVSPLSWRWLSFSPLHHSKRYSNGSSSFSVGASASTSSSLAQPLYRLIPSATGHPASRGMQNHHHNPPTLFRSWKVLGAILLLAFSMIYHRYSTSDDGNNGHRSYSAPIAKWDHNVYVQQHVTTSSGPTLEENFYLIAQLAGSSLQALTDITSRPNRAYARQHSMDYVRYSRGSGGGFLNMNWGHRHSRSSSSIEESKACFDKVILLNTILDKQLRSSSTDHTAVALFSLPSEVKYKAVVLLSPDAIVTDLDCNLFDLLLPPDKLVAIAGFQPDRAPLHTYTARTSTIISSKTDILLFNLQHRRANAVAKLWWDLVEPSEVTCGAGNDLTLLVDAISNVLEDGEELASLIASLDETSDGFVRFGGSRKEISEDSNDIKGGQQQEFQRPVIKCIVPSIPQSRVHTLLSNIDSARVQLQTTADSVCYRYYPRCEVLE